MRMIGTPTISAACARGRATARVWLALFGLALAGLVPTSVTHAQTVSTSCPYSGGCRTISFNATLQVDSVKQIEYTNADPLAFPAPGVSNMENGFLASTSATSLRSRANFRYKVFASRTPNENQYMAATGALASTTKPSSDVRPKVGTAVTSSADGFALAQTETELFGESKGLTRWNTPTAIYYGVLLSWGDPPGTYRQGINFQVVVWP